MAGMGGSIERVTDDDRLTGVRGWLLLPPVVIVINLIAIVIIFIATIASGELATESWPGAALLLAICGVVAGIGLWAMTLLFRERKAARIWMIVFFGIFLAISGFEALASYPYENSFATISVVRGLAIPAAIIAYFLVSRRVKLTLVN